MFIIDDIDENGNIIEELDECEIIELEEDNPLAQILKLLCINE